MVRVAFAAIVVLVAFISAKDLSRSKRQASVYYMCGNAPNTFVSSSPCGGGYYGGYGGYGGCGCNGGYIGGGGCNCNNGIIGGGAVAILPNSFYNAGYNCNNGCSNINCGNYNGQWLNGQYVAYAVGSNQYSPCASSCCGGNYFPPNIITGNNVIPSNIVTGNNVIPPISVQSIIN